ncbi:immunoglobulin E-set, partial [Desarmillaria tabescens]
MTQPSGLPHLSNNAEYATHQQQLARSQVGSSRSISSMKGLLEAENGGAMVELDVCGGTSGFKTGERIVMDPDPLIHDTIWRRCQPRNSQASSAEETALSRHGTLLSVGVTAGRNAAELKSILGNSNSRLKPGAALIPSSTRTSQGDKTSLEQAKPRARVEVDIILSSKTCVQGGFLQGHVKVRIRKPGRKESAVLVSGGKIRVVGFECINGEDDRHTFYQTSTLLSDVSSSFEEMLGTAPDDEGFAKAKEGVFVFPFSMALPLDGDAGNPKGMLHPHSGITVRYIAMFSIKVKESDTGKRSIAHFYRDCEIWPRLNPSTILAPAPVPLQAHATKSLFMGGSGKVTLSASLHRLYWVAGQQCCVKASVTNHTKKTVKSVTLSLLRSTVIFKPRPYLDVEGANVEQDPDACQTTTTEKQIAESTLQMGQHGSRGHASAKGWWTGVPPGDAQEFCHFILIPPDALTMPRGRLLEEEYTLRVSVSAGSLGTDVHVKLPIKIINFLSIDPPPTYP